MLRHRAESGKDGFHFMPFDPADKNGPQGVNLSRLELSLKSPGWQRSFCLINDRGDMIGHVHLKGDMLKTISHRCWLELGVEKPWHRQGLGTALCMEAIRYARDVVGVDWIDLYTFAHNTPARNLYARLGFMEVGRLRDRFRIGNLSIDDVQMTLPLRGQAL